MKTTGKKEITGRAEVILLVDAFYEKIDQDKLLGLVFNEVAQVDWESHLPRMYDFWESVLFGKGNFKGNPMDTHIRLSGMETFTQDHFDRWLDLFWKTLQENFEGEKADLAMERARSIAGIMKLKIQQHGHGNF